MRLLIILIFCVGLVVGESKMPVVLWHGMGDSCCFSFSMDRIKSAIQETLPGTYVYSIRIGDNVYEDVEHGYLGNVNEQIREVCETIKKDANLRNGYNAIGFSQGAQFMRAVIERCNDPPVRNYISIGGQHQGIFGVPACVASQHNYCEILRRVLRYGAYMKYVQESFVQASYWHDPLHENEYKENSLFLADINNERTINQTYKDNLSMLKKMVLLKFKNDSMVVPPESEWFGFFEPGQDKKIVNLQESHLYKEDRLGLRELFETGRIEFLELPGDHLQFTRNWFVENIVKKYLV